MSSFPWIYTPFDALKGLRDSLKLKETNEVVSTILVGLFESVKVNDLVFIVYGYDLNELDGKVLEINLDKRFINIDNHMIDLDNIYYLKIK